MNLRNILWAIALIVTLTGVYDAIRALEAEVAPEQGIETRVANCPWDCQTVEVRK